ncbi:hypothetical protein AVEN_85244-1 [Araneus ventricosus]|uniref:Uncharacterized protein n=1 Tax=Araneus ventricosus TaxID=182803 RepID=A0A4Y2RQQ5_ARAVE|nr:hypothetical protein AVEN_85244-1 [Araneus ventricosus]
MSSCTCFIFNNPAPRTYVRVIRQRYYDLCSRTIDLYQILHPISLSEKIKYKLDSSLCCMAESSKTCKMQKSRAVSFNELTGMHQPSGINKELPKDLLY